MVCLFLSLVATLNTSTFLPPGYRDRATELVHNKSRHSFVTQS